MLTPAEIYAEVESHPPLMQEEAKGKYLGQEVEWFLTFFSGSLYEDQVHLMFHHESRRIGWVTGVVPLSDHLWLKTLRAEEPVQVRGRIRSIDAMAINLDILELSVPETVTR